MSTASCGSTDGRTLYLACSGRRGIWRDERPPLSAFPVLEDGAPGEPRVLAAMVADGMAVDEAGTLYVCAPDERAVVALSAQGDERGRLHMPESPSNCAFAGRGRRMLEITARGSVYSVRMQVAGAP